MYSAKNIASAVIIEYNNQNSYISNLKLQKVLYYIQVDMLQKNGECAFSDEIEAWRHGPVVRDVYYIYRSYISGPINPDDPQVQENKVELDEKLEKIVKNIVERTKDIDAWDLVDKTHQTKAWEKAYIPAQNNIIPCEDLLNCCEVNI